MFRGLRMMPCPGAFAAAWPERTIGQGRLHNLTWSHQVALLEKLVDDTTRLWYAEQTRKYGRSRNRLALQKTREPMTSKPRLPRKPRKMACEAQPRLRSDATLAERFAKDARAEVKSDRLGSGPSIWRRKGHMSSSKISQEQRVTFDKIRRFVPVTARVQRGRSNRSAAKLFAGGARAGATAKQPLSQALGGHCWHQPTSAANQARTHFPKTRRERIRQSGVRA
jgi:hypothetical protein